MSREYDAPDADAPVTIQLSPTARIHTFPKRTPKYTAQDHEDMGDVRRLLLLEQALKHIRWAHTDLHQIFGEVIRTDEPWPFFSVRQMQNYVPPEKFALFTHNEKLLEAARVATRLGIEQHLAQLSRALLADTGGTLSATSGLDLRKDAQELKRLETTIELIRDVIDGATPEEQMVLAKVARVTQHGLRSMFNLGSSLSNMAQSAIENVAPASVPTTLEHDTEYLPVRRKMLRLCEQWVHVAMCELTLMKLDLLADYKDPDRGARKQQDMFDGALVEVTEPQREFIETDAQNYRDLQQAAKTLHLALIS